MLESEKKRDYIVPAERIERMAVPDSEKPYSIPLNWCWLNLLDSFENKTDSTRKIKQKDYLTEGKYAIVDQGQALIGGYTNDEVMLFTGKTPIIIFGDHTRCIKYIDFPFAQGADGVKVLSPKDFFDAKAFYYALQSISIPNLGYRRHYPLFKNFYIPLPPMKEQQRIVERIESLFAKLDEAKEKAQAVVDGFEDRKAAILHKAFTGELTEKWRNNSGVTLESWNTENLEESFDVSGGIQKQPSRMPDKNPVPYITVANVYRNRIDLTDLRYFEVFPGELEKLQLKYGDILIVEGNGSGSEIGRCAMWRNELPVCIHQNHIIRVRRKNESVLPEYVLYYLNSSAGRQIMKSRAKTTAGLYNLSTGKIKTIPVPYASLEEQKEIVRMLDYLLEKELQVKDKAETTIEEIDNMKKSILSRAFRGELGTNDPNDESAVELLKRIL